MIELEILYPMIYSNKSFKCNKNQTHKHLVSNRTLNHRANWRNIWTVLRVHICMEQWLFMFIMSHTFLEWIYTLWLRECQGTSCSKQARYLKFKRLQRDSNPQHLKPFSQTDQMTGLCCEYLALWYTNCAKTYSKWYHVFITWNRTFLGP